MNEADKNALSKLIRGQRQAALAVIADGAPLTAMVAYAEFADLSAVLVYLSNLSAHKRALMAHPSCSLLICEPDSGAGDVMTLARVALQGRADKIHKDEPGYARARECYLAKLPDAALLFTLPDFDLIQITPTAARYVAGFGRAITVAVWPPA